MTIVSPSTFVENFGNIVLIAITISSLFLVLLRDSFCCCSGWRYKADNFVRAYFDADTATGTKCVVDIEAGCLSVKDFVNLVGCCRVYCAKLQCVNWTCDHTVVATSTALHVDMHCKGHFCCTSLFKVVLQR